jgi:FAD binding domain of DNA photolyase
MCRWVPEVAALPIKCIHAPWAAPIAELKRAGVQLGKTYPVRVVSEDFQSLRARNLHSMRVARAKHPELQDSNGYDVIPVPPGAASGVPSGRVRVFTVPGIRDSGSKAAAGQSRATPSQKGKRVGGRNASTKKQRLLTDFAP